MSLFKGNIAMQSEFPDLESLSDELSLMQKPTGDQSGIKYEFGSWHKYAISSAHSAERDPVSEP